MGPLVARACCLAPWVCRPLHGVTQFKVVRRPETLARSWCFRQPGSRPITLCREGLVSATQHTSAVYFHFCLDYNSTTLQIICDPQAIVQYRWLFSKTIVGVFHADICSRVRLPTRIGGRGARWVVRRRRAPTVRLVDFFFNYHRYAAALDHK